MAKKLLSFQAAVPSPGVSGVPNEKSGKLPSGRGGRGFLRKETNYGKPLMERNPQTHTVVIHDSL